MKTLHVNKYPDDYINKIICGDCLEVMKGMQDKSIDMILCDLPYGTTQNKWDSIIPLGELWAQYDRTIKDNGAIVLTAQTPFDKVLGCSNLRLLKYEWIWKKTQGTGHLNSHKMPMKNHENILVFYKSLPTYNPQKLHGNPYICKRGKLNSTNYGKQSDGIVTVNNGDRFPATVIAFNSDKGLHPTQKPVALFEYLIKTYTNEGDTVLDNCMGSGTTGVACKNLNRNFIGIEKEPKYCAIAEERLRILDMQPKLLQKEPK
jgi:site-specific DNA-methyltransferase (adenine-specific)